MASAASLRPDGLSVVRVRPSDRTRSPLDAYTVADLRAYADEHNVDLAGATRKADIIAAIENGTGDRTDDEQTT